MKYKISLPGKALFLLACVINNNMIGFLGPVNNSFNYEVKTTRSGSKAVDMPNVLFAFNSSKMYKAKNEDEKTYEQKVNIWIGRVKKIFDEETSTIIEITGHCDSREKNKKKLSLARAKYIADELIKKGINKKRISIKGEGDEEPLIPEATIKAAPTNDEKEEMYLQNRRITIKIVRWDFKE